MSDMELLSLQSLLSVVGPPEGQDRLPAFIKAATKALGAKSDAVLAGKLGVEPSSIANWRRRGSVPENYYAWFRSALLEKIITYNSELRPVSVEARQAVVALIVKTSGNPLGLRASVEQATAIAMPGLLCAAEFLIEALVAHGQDRDDVATARVVELLDAAALMFRKADQLRQFR